MGYKTVTVDVDLDDLDVDLNDFDDSDLIEEINNRGYTIITSEDKLTQNEFDVIYSMLNDLDNWEHRRIRNKLKLMEELL